MKYEKREIMEQVTQQQSILTPRKFGTHLPLTPNVCSNSAAKSTTFTSSVYSSNVVKVKTPIKQAGSPTTTTANKTQHESYSIIFQPGNMGLELEPIILSSESQVGCRVKDYYFGLDHKGIDKDTVQSRIMIGDIISEINGVKVQGYKFLDILLILKELKNATRTIVFKNISSSTATPSPLQKKKQLSSKKGPLSSKQSRGDSARPASLFNDKENDSHLKQLHTPTNETRVTQATPSVIPASDSNKDVSSIVKSVSVAIPLFSTKEMNDVISTKNDLLTELSKSTLKYGISEEKRQHLQMQYDESLVTINEQKLLIEKLLAAEASVTAAKTVSVEAADNINSFSLVSVQDVPAVNVLNVTSTDNNVKYDKYDSAIIEMEEIKQERDNVYTILHKKEESLSQTYALNHSLREQLRRAESNNIALNNEVSTLISTVKTAQHDLQLEVRNASMLLDDRDRLLHEVQQLKNTLQSNQLLMVEAAETLPALSVYESTEYKQLNEELDRYKVMINKWRCDIVILTNQVSLIQEERDSSTEYKQMLFEKEVEIAKLSTALSASSDEVNNHKVMCEELRERLELALATNDTKDSEMSRLQAVNEAQVSKVMDLHTLVQQHSDDSAMKGKRVVELEASLQQYLSQLDDAQKQIDQQSVVIASRDTDIRDISASNKELSSELTDGKVRFLETIAHIRDMYDATIATMTVDHDEKELALHEHVAQLQMLQQSMKAYAESELNSMSSLLNEKTAEIEEVCVQNAHLKDRLDDVIAAVDEKDSYIHQVSSLQQQVDSGIQLNHELQATINFLQATQQHHVITAENTQYLTEQFTLKADLVSKYEQENAKLLVSLRATMAIVAVLKLSVTGVKDDISQLVSQHDEITAAFEQRFRSMNDENNTLHTRLSQLHLNESNYINTIHRLEERVVQCEQKYANTLAILVEKEKELIKSVEMYDILSNENSSNEHASQLMISSLQSSLSEADGNCSRLESRLTAMQVENKKTICSYDTMLLEVRNEYERSLVNAKIEYKLSVNSRDEVKDDQIVSLLNTIDALKKEIDDIKTDYSKLLISNSDIEFKYSESLKASAEVKMELIKSNINIEQSQEDVNRLQYTLNNYANTNSNSSSSGSSSSYSSTCSSNSEEMCQQLKKELTQAKSLIASLQVDNDKAAASFKEAYTEITSMKRCESDTKATYTALKETLTKELVDRDIAIDNYISDIRVLSAELVVARKELSSINDLYTNVSKDVLQYRSMQMQQERKVSEKELLIAKLEGKIQEHCTNELKYKEHIQSMISTIFTQNSALEQASIRESEYRVHYECLLQQYGCANNLSTALCSSGGQIVGGPADSSMHISSLVDSLYSLIRDMCNEKHTLLLQSYNGAFDLLFTSNDALHLNQLRENIILLANCTGITVNTDISIIESCKLFNYSASGSKHSRPANPLAKLLQEDSSLEFNGDDGISNGDGGIRFMPINMQ